MHIGDDGQARCGWCSATPDYQAYHDDEWGYPVSDDQRLFEKICLEGFQSGLSWRTILEKRENFRDAFHGFDMHRMAAMTDDDVTALLGNAGIVRHRGKIQAVINNAARCLELIEAEGSFAAYVWRYEVTGDARPGPQVVATTEASVAMSKDLKKRGWKFVGPTTVYAFMQAMGLVNDHALDCAIHAKAEQARAGFKPPV
ncbi:DNA-3-methyladenine glycosylase I [Pseudoprimorskyibacter insulae]|uniref:DNA-3-methyladenine glycosylase 1 n=1 Tax=Pseudoprimorskyibacter insulae TaxID=1695997 RepID=A0A2R8AV51_9RHOB|nr:DNA-3-methyladenine glycosylase I [Pseudoprimorskyibacter insulae]SPF79797.1 DNA-3-methyladenine glycosylase 1 [Pseudoprimorskyibacter insulae]